MHWEHLMSAISKKFRAWRSSGKLWCLYSALKSHARWISVPWHKLQRKRVLRHAAMSAWCNLQEETLTSVVRYDTLVLGAKELSLPFYWERLDTHDCDQSDLHSFGPLKQFLGSHSFHYKAAVVISVCECLCKRYPYFNRDGVVKLLPKLEKYILVLGGVWKIMILLCNKLYIYILLWRFLL
jgi:hypothetical protein